MFQAQGSALLLSFVLCAAAQGQMNLLPNGDFEAGNTGFASDYGYSGGGNCCEGQYAVRGDGSSFNGFFVNPPPAAVGSTSMMVVNGSTLPNQRVWYVGLNLPSAGRYRFTLRGCTAVAGGPAVLSWQINGSLIGGTLALPSETGRWVTLDASWDAPGPGSIELAVRNLNTAFFPNDFYIDELYVSDFSCAADIGTSGGVPGHDGLLNNNDFIVFIDYFFSGDPVADIGTTGGSAGPDGALDNNDFIVFIDRFFAGC